MMPDAPDQLTPEIVASREILAVEMMLNSGDIANVLGSPGLSDEQVVAMMVAYAFAVLIGGASGPRELLLDPVMNPIVKQAIETYPADVKDAANRVVNQVIHLLAQLPDPGTSGVG